MNNQLLITDKESFINTAAAFFNTMFEPAFNSERGNIEIRIFPKGQQPQQYFYGSETEAAEKAYELCNQGIDVYFGINPRIGNGGKKENIHYLSAFHAEIDYGEIGHKKGPSYGTYEDALKAIQTFNPEPTVIVHSGGGFHCYWVLSNSIKISDVGIPALESINKTLSLKLGGDPGTQDISRVLRVPGTFNFKMQDNPRSVSLISNNHQGYTYDDFRQFISNAVEDQKKNEKTIPEIAVNNQPSFITGTSVDIDHLPVSDRIKFLIRNGNDGKYLSRSEADMAVITALVNKGVSDADIKQLFQTQKIGEKYRSHPKPDQYLNHSIEEARKRSNLTEDEMIDSLFIWGAITKDNNNKYNLKILKFEEYMVRKYKIIILDQERATFRYNGICYEQCTEKALNKLCQDELKSHREIFGKSSLSEFIHYAVGDILVDSEKVKKDQLNYLTMQNGLYNIEAGTLIDHTPAIFTTNLLPYNYNPEAKCPRFIQYLKEIFPGDEEKINFIQEAVGYAFHKSLPTPAMFFLIGDGDNGKSVFINTITNLMGKENTSSISFNALSNEYYILDLFQKMLNISGETPHSNNFNTDIIKAVTAGDWVTGRELYKQPMKFRPFAKHFLAMNKPPVITDTSHGMWRRIWVITFPKKFEPHEMDRQLEYKLSLELSGIFNWAIEGYNRLKGKDFALKESDTMKLAKTDYRSSTDSTRAFINDNLKTADNPDKRLKFGDLYELYKKYCQSGEKRDFESKDTLKKALKDLKYEVKCSTRDGNQVCVFNVELKLDEDKDKK